ncbi:MAG: hypothetical protein K2K04_03175, partial [Clostridia bacterium]|nr:hypothetical protein [Clostridia bacterium]
GLTKGEQTANSAENKAVDDEFKKMWNEFDASYPPFRYSLKLPCIIAAVATLIVGIIIFSIVFTNLPCAKEIMAWQEGTPEPEGAVKSAVVAIITGVVAIIAAVVAAVFIARAVAKKMQARNYVRAKMSKFNDYKKLVQREKAEERKRAEEQRKLDAIFTCKFCGDKLYVIQNDGDVVDKSYVEKQYSVEVTGYNKAVLKPEYNTLKWKERVGQKIVCGCRKCNYEISRSQGDYFADVTIAKGSIITSQAVKETEAYKYVDTYKFRDKSDV